MVRFECKNSACYFEDNYGDNQAPYLCPKCQMKTYRLRYIKEPKKKERFVNIDGTSRENERWSWSMGVNVQDIPKAMKQYPGSEYHPKTGQLRVKSRQHKKQEMQRRGYYD